VVFSLPWFTKYLEISPKKSGILLIITGWGESGKVILQVSIAVFSGTVKKIFRQRWLSPPRKNWPDILNPRRQVSILEREPDIAVYKHGACLNTRISYDMRVTYDVCWDKLTKDKLKDCFFVQLTVAPAKRDVLHRKSTATTTTPAETTDDTGVQQLKNNSWTSGTLLWTIYELCLSVCLF